MPSPAIYHPEISMEMSKNQNASPYHFDRNISRNPENIISIFTVNTRPQYSASAGVRFAGRSAENRYLKVGTISDPKYYVDDLSVEGSVKKNITADDGKWVAMDWLNPNNIFSLDQNFQAPVSEDDGTDLISRGLFFIVRPFDPARGNSDDEPTEAEIKAAEDRLRKRYTALVQLYHRISTSSPAKLSGIINEEMVDALNFAGMSTPYNTALQQRIVCATCGDMKVAGAKFHRSESLGVICIEPTVDGWKAAVAAGVKKREDVPEGMGWPGRSKE